jgi:hypothetical protein
VAIGVTLSLLGTGPFVQALGYLGPRFSASGKHLLTSAITYRMIALGLLGSLTLTGVLVIVNAFTSAFSWQRVEVMAVYGALVALLWMTNAAAFMLKRYDITLLSLAVSMPVVGIVLNDTTWGIYAAHWIGLGVAIALQLGGAAAVLRRRSATMDRELRLAVLPRRSLLLRSAVPFALYGICYYVLLLADRAAAWSTGHHPLPIWFNVRYELGLDVALFAAAIGIAFLECTIHAFTRLATPRQSRFSALDVRGHNRYFARFHVRQLMIVAALALAGAGAALGIAVSLHHLHGLGSIARYYSDPATRRVFVLAVVGYGLLAIGSANAGLLFVLGRPWLVVRGIAFAAALDLAVSFTLSRAAGFSFAIVGLVAGAAAFMLLTGYYAARALRRADYYLYSAY